MGCGASSNSMDIYEPRSFKDKTLIWLLGGGPGAPKPQVAMFLIERFKFKYVSAAEMMAYDEKAGSPDAPEIKKCMDQKQLYPSELVLKVLRRFLSLFGPRKYLIEGFPRNEADVTALNAMIKQYNRVEMMGYINIELTEQQMRDSGVRTLKERKKEESEENIEKEVRTIIEEYRNKIKPVTDYYSAHSNFISEEWKSQDVYQLNLRLEAGLNKQDVKQVRNVPVHFLTGSQPKEVKDFAIKLSKRFGMLSWTLQELIEEAKKNPQFKKETDEPLDKVSEQFIVQLMARKIEKTNYKGPYLFAGYPRKEQDLTAFRIVFLQEVTFSSFTCCFHTPIPQNEEAVNEKLKKFFTEKETTPCSMITAGEGAYNQIEFHVGKTIKGGPPPAGKLVVMPALGDQGANSPIAKSSEVNFVEFKSLLKKEINENHLYSDLINSNQALDRPLPPPLASSIVLKALNQHVMSQKAGEAEKLFVVRGYPQTVEQAKVMFSRSPELRILSSIIFEGQAPKGKEGKLAQNQQIEAALELACNYSVKVSEKTTSEEFKKIVLRIASI